MHTHEAKASARMAMKSDTCRCQTPTSPRSIVYQWQDTPVNEDVAEYMHKLRWTEEFIESIEWENDITIWCGTCERTFNSDSQWKDHVRGKPHAKYLLDFRGQDPYLRKQGCPLFTKVRNETFYNSRFEGSKADTYVLATYLIKLMQELKETAISALCQSPLGLQRTRRISTKARMLFLQWDSK